MAEYCENCYDTCGHNCGDNCDYQCTNQCYDMCGSCTTKCSAMCESNCDDGCRGGCNFLCWQDCSASCEGDCGNSCTTSCYQTCTMDCQEVCSYNCSGYCTNCGLDCGMGCGGDSCQRECKEYCQISCYLLCQSNCINACQTACYKSCTGDCDHGCVSSCYGTCTTGCQGNCTGECTGNCGDTCSTGNDNSCGDCSMNCSSGCSGRCQGCGSGCSGSCSSSCQGTCYYSCQDGCQNTCSGQCIGLCESQCLLSCSLDCNANCVGICEILCSSSCSGFCSEICDTSCMYYCTSEAFSIAFSKLIFFNEYNVLVNYVFDHYGDLSENGVSLADINKKIFLNDIISDLILNIQTKRPSFSSNLQSQQNKIIKKDDIEDFVEDLVTVEYTLCINENEEDEDLACFYPPNSDAYGMVKGSNNWDILPIFNEIKPCIFKNGEVQYYLDKNNFALKENGDEANLTGTDGDVMIEFPRCAYRIFREDNINDDTHNVYISITNDIEKIKNDKRYNLDAFSRNEIGDLNHFYIGAFLGYISSERLRSLPGKQPASSYSYNTFLSCANNNYTLTSSDVNYDENKKNYRIMCYPQLKLIQCLYLIKYGNRNFNSTIGYGNCYSSGGSSNSNNKILYTGYNTSLNGDPSYGVSTLDKGMCYGENQTNRHMKLFGIEDFYGNLLQILDGFFCYMDENSVIYIISAYGKIEEYETLEDFLSSQKTKQFNTHFTYNGYSQILSNGGNSIQNIMGNSIASFVEIQLNNNSTNAFWGSKVPFSDLYVSKENILKNRFRFGKHFYSGTDNCFFKYDYALTTSSFVPVGARLTYV